MRTIILTIILVVLLIIAGGTAFIYSGTYQIAASAPENPVFAWILSTTMRHSVSRYAASVPQPPPLDNAQMVEAGAGHYHENCQVCHGGPGVERSELAQGLQPQAPDLAKSGQERTPRELFWVAKHGIKWTAMPAWGPTHSDDELWAIVAFLRKLHALSPQQFAAMGKGHHHHDAQGGQQPDPAAHERGHEGHEYGAAGHEHGPSGHEHRPEGAPTR
ncbi:MAG: c-type cytochrome [Thiohalocapsa sp.]